MANWYGAARSNYFRVKNAENFKAWAYSMSNIILIEQDEKFGFYSDCPDGGAFPSSINEYTTVITGQIKVGDTLVFESTFTHQSDEECDESTLKEEAEIYFKALPEWVEGASLTLEIGDTDQDETEIDWVNILTEHLAEGEVAILMEAGAEKLRYITGWAQAISWDGRVNTVSLDDIYAKAAAEFGVDIDSITRAAY